MSNSTNLVVNPWSITVNGVRCIALNENTLSCDWNNQKQGEK